MLDIYFFAIKIVFFPSRLRLNRSERLLLLLPFLLWLRPWTYGAPRFNGYEKWPISSRGIERKQLSRRAAWSFAPRVPPRATILRDFPFVEHVQTYTIVYKYLDNLWRQWKNIIKLYGCLELNCNFWISYVTFRTFPRYIPADCAILCAISFKKDVLRN